MFKESFRTVFFMIDIYLHTHMFYTRILIALYICQRYMTESLTDVRCDRRLVNNKSDGYDGI